MQQNVGNLPFQPVEIRGRFGELALRLLHLHRRNHIHGLRDFHRVTDALYTVLDFSCLRHLKNSSAAFSRLSRRSSDIFPEVSKRFKRSP